jgi:hypothetical protein
VTIFGIVCKPGDFFGEYWEDEAFFSSVMCMQSFKVEELMVDKEVSYDMQRRKQTSDLQALKRETVSRYVDKDIPRAVYEPSAD